VEDKPEDMTAAAALPLSSSPTESVDQQTVTEELKETEQAWQVQCKNFRSRSVTFLIRSVV